jgi:2-keto-4-pentenoate hydratase/2-oxohepta-3-ene-1,7-dioic acid hydratase in catechol pathway
LDANLAHATMLAGRDRHPCARQLADVLVPSDMLALVQTGRFGLEAIAESLAYFEQQGTPSRVEGASLIHQVDAVEILAPLPQPLSIRDGVGFLDHLRNAMGDNPIPQVYEDIPAIYYKGNVHSVIGPGADVLWPAFGEMLDFELEVAAVIGRQGVDIAPEQALDHVFGYTIFNDISARAQQYREMEGMLGPAKGKDFDTANIMGPVLVTADAFDPTDSHGMVARINGEEWSRGDLNRMDNSFADMISYISRQETLYPGDIICSGTVPTGCGAELGKFPAPGDEVELEVEGIGLLKNRLVKKS